MSDSAPSSIAVKAAPTTVPQLSDEEMYALFGPEPSWWPDGTFAEVMALDIDDRSSERYSRLQALWVRVIIRAAFDLASHKDDRKLACKKWALDAEKWLFSPSYLFNSFENVCAMIGIDPEKFRAWAKSLTKENVRKMEHMERTTSSSKQASDGDVFAIVQKNFRR